ncbi:MAG: Chromate resistance protein ChrB [Marmoricola sp.]
MDKNETMVTHDWCVWVLLSYRIPREPSTPRIAIWRKLRRLGVAQIGDGLAALPADARTLEQLEWLAEEIAEAEGASTLWRAELTSAAQEQAVIQEMTIARSAEYADIAARAKAVRLSSATPSQGVRSLRSLRQELRRVQRRDFFPPIGREVARAEIDALAHSLLADGAPAPNEPQIPTLTTAPRIKPAEVES